MNETFLYTFWLANNKKNAIIVNSRICFQQAIYALNLIDISFYGKAGEIGSENETQFVSEIFWTREFK